MKVLILNPPSKYVKNVVRDLFYGCWCKGKRIASAKFPPTTLMYISAVLKNGGFDVKLLDSQSEDLSYEKVMDITEKYKPDAVVITTSTMTFREDMDALKEVKKRTGAMTLVFGSHVTFKVEDAAKDNDAIDVYVQKEPEHIIRDVIKAVDKGKDWRKVKGIAYKDKIGKNKKGNLKKGKLKINEPYPFIDPLDEMPFPDRDVVSKFEYFNPLVKKLPWTTAITSRGCPGRCNFCNSPVFYGKSIRLRSPENVVDEMEDVVLNGYKEVFYRDETFTVDKKRTLEICRLIKDRGVKISWICSSRINTIDEETIKEQYVVWADSTFFNVFSIPIIQGDAKTALVEPNSIAISESLAKKYFGDSDPIGKYLELSSDADREGNIEPRLVTGIIEDLPQQSHLQFSDYLQS